MTRRHLCRDCNTLVNVTGLTAARSPVAIAGRAALTLRPATRAESRKAVRAWHSHHKAHVGEIVAIGGCVGGVLVAVVVVGRPVAPALASAGVLEVTRLAVGPDAPHCAASRLLGAAWRTASGMGCRRLVSYTREDEAGTCYRAAGWRATATVKPSKWTHGNHSLRWLPGLYVPSTETIARVRWEIGPDAEPAMARTVPLDARAAAGT